MTPDGSVLHVGDTPEGVVIDDATGTAVVALRQPDSIALVRLNGTKAFRVIRTPGRARHLRLASSSGPLLLPGEDANALFEISLPSGAVVARYATGRQPHDAVEVDGQVWVTDELAGKVSVLGDGVDKSLPSGLQPGGLDAAAGRVAVADVRGNALYVFDAKSQKQVAVLPAGAGPTHVVRVGPSTVAVADTRGNAILLYDLSGRPRQLFRLELAGGPVRACGGPLPPPALGCAVRSQQTRADRRRRQQASADERQHSDSAATQFGCRQLVDRGVGRRRSDRTRHPAALETTSQLKRSAAFADPPGSSAPG